MTDANFALFMYWKGFNHGKNYVLSVNNNSLSLNATHIYDRYSEYANELQKARFKKSFTESFGLTPVYAIPSKESVHIWDEITKGL